MELTAGELAAIADHAEAAAPVEACGVVLDLPKDRVHPCHNAHPDPRYGYRISVSDMMTIVECGAPVLAIYHSHVDAPGTFSDEDERGALLAVAALPDTRYLVVEVRGRRAMSVRTYVWLAPLQRFGCLGLKNLLDAETLAS